MTEYFTKDGDNYVKVDETLHTQADLDKVVKDRAERIARQNYSDYDELKEKAGKFDTTTKELNDKLTAKDTELGELSKKLTAAELATDKVKLINEFKLSDDLAEFVTGDSVDEMRQRAEKLSKGIKPGNVTVTKDGKPNGGDGKNNDSRTIAQGLFGKKSDD